MKCAGFSADGVYQIRHASGSLADIGKTYCSDEPSKKECCAGVVDVTIQHGAKDEVICGEKGGDDRRR